MKQCGIHTPSLFGGQRKVTVGWESCAAGALMQPLCGDIVSDCVCNIRLLTEDSRIALSVVGVGIRCGR